jgi:hypothetical protein
MYFLFFEKEKKEKKKKSVLYFEFPEKSGWIGYGSGKTQTKKCLRSGCFVSVSDVFFDEDTHRIHKHLGKIPG